MSDIACRMEVRDCVELAHILAVAVVTQLLPFSDLSSPSLLIL